jgi:L-serine dehydratase
MENNPGIFNDVIGPVMRGPSSSHTAASWRIANFALQLLNEELQSALIEFDKNGAWASNYREQGTVLGMTGGLMSIDLMDDQIKSAEQLASDKRINIRYQISAFKNDHPNSMRLQLKGSGNEKIEMLAVSTGGGAFEIRIIDGHKVKSAGIRHELFIWSSSKIIQEIEKVLKKNVYDITFSDNDSKLFNIKSIKPFPEHLIHNLKLIPGLIKISYVKPIMPVIIGKDPVPDFFDADKIIEYAKEQSLSLGELGLIYEKCITGLGEDELNLKMQNIINIIEKSIDVGLSGTDYKDRIYPQQSHLVNNAEKEGSILKDSVINDIVKYVSAIMESKSGMEVIVANPTAGSCGTVGGLIKAVAGREGKDMKDKIRAYFAAGLIGIYFAKGPGFSAEEHGCQVECGSASAMAAAGIVQLFGGNTAQAFSAASLALQNMIGLVCDPIADRVEAPCLGKNINAAVNALSSATMAMSGYMHLIPFEQVTETVIQVSAGMPDSVKCTGLGGLSVTQAAKNIKEKLKK